MCFIVTCRGSNLVLFLFFFFLPALAHPIFYVNVNRINFGRGRSIPRQKLDGINIHRSVKIRLEAGNAVEGGKYAPKAKWHVEPNWVD